VITKLGLLPIAQATSSAEIPVAPLLNSGAQSRP
jgi:hypothetical protein